tara:strand:- start:103986 stop:105014 length:1029 start_codon:yes stop_codon:yes gene_type:complete
MVAIESNQPNEILDKIESVAESKRATGRARASENEEIAELLGEIAKILSEQGASEFRVQAYQNARNMLSSLPTPVRAVFDHEGLTGLIELPTIGHSIANLIEQYLRSGRIPLLDRLRGEETAERIFCTLPNIGPELSHRIHEHLQIESLPELYAAARDGRLAKVPGIGRKRIRAIRECLAERLRPRTSPTETAGNAQGTCVESSIGEESIREGLTRAQWDHSVPVNELLDVDAEYRRLAAAGKLPQIAPHRFNPGAVAWLPILHTQYEDRHYTAMYSNTARAHELNTTRDWVIIYRDDPNSHGRWTVITSQFGQLRGCRIVRGREEECLAHYRQGVEDGRTR